MISARGSSRGHWRDYTFSSPLCNIVEYRHIRLVAEPRKFSPAQAAGKMTLISSEGELFHLLGEIVDRIGAHAAPRPRSKRSVMRGFIAPPAFLTDELKEVVIESPAEPLPREEQAGGRRVVRRGCCRSGSVVTAGDRAGRSGPPASALLPQADVQPPRLASVQAPRVLCLRGALH